jgi:hypothetical protein
MAISGSTETYKFEFPIINPPRNIIFLDVDGVLNCQLFYTERYNHLTRYDNIPLYKVVKKHLKKLLKKKEIGQLEYYKSEMCPMRISLLNQLCEETNSAVVLSASMRGRWTPLQLNRIFQYCGATFTIIDKTPRTGYERGTDISLWLKDNCMKWFGVNYYDFYRYAIIDDDSDMLLNQADHFFHTDNYSGLTPNTTYKIRRYFNHKTF